MRAEDSLGRNGCRGVVPAMHSAIGGAVFFGYLFRMARFVRSAWGPRRHFGGCDRCGEVRETKRYFDDGVMWRETPRQMETGTWLCMACLRQLERDKLASSMQRAGSR